jgi:hypothetical protein
MPVNLENLRSLVRAGRFADAFCEELGWSHDFGSFTVDVNGARYKLDRVAELSSFVVYTCHCDDPGGIPDKFTRQKIESRLRKDAEEHIVIFNCDHAATQIWSWARRDKDQPVRLREIPLREGQTGQALVEQIQELEVTFAEVEKGVPITTTVSKARKAFDVDRVTRKFYDRFKSEHAAFLGFISGITQQGDLEWYASVMLNRLMFVYFIQKKGFLDDKPDYLRVKMAEVRAVRGEGEFHTFYRRFLLRLFHEGLGLPKGKRDQGLDSLIGDVPYLNGGLFEFHKIERDYSNIDIPDRAFEAIFDFFDAYDWRLDQRELRKDNEINPDVLGYIFEKYINQKQMGAYYTKEDITGYIARNTVIPSLLDAAQKNCFIAFRPDGALWNLLVDNPDRYIYESIRRGVDLDLPGEIEAGINDPSRRSGWNAPAFPRYALPTETWREYVNRRQRCRDDRSSLAGGEIREIDQLVERNLDIRQFIQDVIEDADSPDLIRAFYKAITQIAVLDPGCGSGAFLFAALEILQPLYDACLDRMEAFVEQQDNSADPDSSHRLLDLRDILQDASQHPNRNYFVLKSIVLNNLFGVDIMEEAIEICKLRLFLKLVAQLEPGTQMEPLPDIDFNVVSGNSLVGFTDMAEVRSSHEGKLDLFGNAERIERDAGLVADLYASFRRMQTDEGVKPQELPAAKAGIRAGLIRLERQLNTFLAAEFGVDTAGRETVARWQSNFRPFHWFVEFYDQLTRGGFDVIIGNPPYVELSVVSEMYTLLPSQYTTENCGNLYACFLERAIRLSTRSGRVGMIVPVSSICTDGYQSLRKLLLGSGYLISSSYSDRPAKLFDGLEHARLSILLLARGSACQSPASGDYAVWSSAERDSLFPLRKFHRVSVSDHGEPIPKVGSSLAQATLARLPTHRSLKEFIDDSGGFKIYYTRKLSYFAQILDRVPTIHDSSGRQRPPSELKVISFASDEIRWVYLAALNSSLFRWLLAVHSDCRNLNRRDVVNLPLDYSTCTPVVRDTLSSLARALMNDLAANSQVVPITYKSTGTLNVQCFFPKLSKPIIDEIDLCLGSHFQMLPEEVDFVINWDVKYRMGTEV